MKTRILILWVIACFVPSVLKAQYHPQISFYGADQAEALFNQSSNDLELYLNSASYLVKSFIISEKLDSGDLLALYNMYLYERSSIIEVDYFGGIDEELVSSFDFGAKCAEFEDDCLYFESPVTRIDSRLFTKNLRGISLPRIQGITYESSPEINVENLAFIEGYHVIDNKVLLDDYGKMIVAATASEESFTIPDCIEYIGDGAVRGCTCQSILIPESVKSIGKEAFSSCFQLKSVYLASPIPGDYLTSEVFGSTPLSSITFFVPQSALKYYKKAYPALKKQFKKAKYRTF